MFDGVGYDFEVGESGVGFVVVRNDDEDCC